MKCQSFPLINGLREWFDELGLTLHLLQDARAPRSRVHEGSTRQGRIITTENP
jgi:hypothetical protein